MVITAALVSGCLGGSAGPTDSDGSAGPVDSARGESRAPAPSSSQTPSTPTASTPTASDPTASAPTSSSPTPSPSAASITALSTLARLPVKGRAPLTGYDRARFGQAWLDADRNGCDTRNDVLGVHLTAVVFRPGTRDCVVESGDLDDPYTSRRIHFVRGDGFLVDVDHVVALANAWVTGGAGWDIRKRAALANDPLNLEPVDASANRQKGDGDAATWLPPNKAYRCSYVARQVGVKHKYGLWVTPPEARAIGRVLAKCPEQRLPEDSGAPTSVTQNLREP